MLRVSLIWVEEPGLEGLDPQAIADAASVELAPAGMVEAAVVTVSEDLAPPVVLSRTAGKPVRFLDLAGEVGSGPAEHRQARAAAAISRAAGRAALGVLPPVYSPKPNLSVLVAGAGLAAVAAAREIALLGHPVLLATPGKDAAQAGGDNDPEEVSLLAAQLPAGVAVAADTRLVSLAGSAGGFRAWLKPAGQKKVLERFGAVVVSPPGSWQVVDEGLEFDPELCIPISAAAGHDIQGKEESWAHVAVLAGVNRPISAGAFARAVGAALAMQDRPHTQAYLFFNEALAATEGGERLYRQARDKGVLTVRVAPGGLGLEQGGRLLKWHDPLLDEQMELEPGLVVLPEESRALRPAFFDNKVRWPAWEDLLPENARLSGGRTARSGLYILGALRETSPGTGRLIEAAAAAADMHDVLSRPGAPAPAVRLTYCASCLNCLVSCPHGAIIFTDKIECAPAACVGCGICAAQCPAEAIAPPGWSNPELRAGLERGLAAASGTPLVLFACSQSAAPAFYQLSRQGRQWPQGLLIFPVNCAGRVGQALIIKALELGAKGVLTAGCHDGNCRSINGNRRARLRTGHAAKLLEEAGLDADSIRFLHMAGNQPQRLAQAVQELAAKAGEE